MALPPRASHRASAAALLALVATLAACGNRENERGNDGGGPQTPGVQTGTNPADASQQPPTATREP